MVNFTKQDVELLMQAVERWETPDAREVFAGMKDLIGCQCSACNPNGPLDFIQKIQANESEIDRRIRESLATRKERSIVLRAKLIALRDSVVADEFLGSCGAEKADGCKSQSESAKS